MARKRALVGVGALQLVVSFDVDFVQRSNKSEAQTDVGHGTLKMRRYVLVCEDEGINRSSTMALSGWVGVP
jgi:hypothetical protein